MVDARQYKARNKSVKRCPFGMLMEERSYTATAKGYRFGFNGQERDNEVNGCGNTIAFEVRIYDSRLGRFMSIDPAFKDFAMTSPYSFAINSPILFIDFLGESPKKPVKKKTKPVISPFTTTEIELLIIKQGGLKEPSSGGLNPSLSLIKSTISFENLSLELYDWDGSTAGNATIGFGHKVHSGTINGSSSEIEFKNGITKEKAVSLLISDISIINESFGNQVKNRGLKGIITQNEYDVGFDLAYNAGVKKAGKYLKRLENIKSIEAGGNQSKAIKERDNLADWLTKQYPGNDKERGRMRFGVLYNDYGTKGSFLNEAIVRKKKK